MRRNALLVGLPAALVCCEGRPRCVSRLAAGVVEDADGPHLAPLGARVQSVVCFVEALDKVLLRAHGSGTPTLVGALRVLTVLLRMLVRWACLAGQVPNFLDGFYRWPRFAESNEESGWLRGGIRLCLS